MSRTPGKSPATFLNYLKDCNTEVFRNPRFGGFGVVLLLISMLLPAAGCLPPDEGMSGVGEKAEASSDSAMPDGRTRAISLAAKATPSARSRYREAPSLRQRVEANDLPPLEERLPDIPLVVAPISEPGRYGGTIRRAVIADIIDRTAVSKTLNENLMGYERPLARAIQLNLAESYEFIDEGRSVIFKLRQGTRWSDGEPFKVDDILFWYEDVALSENARNDPLFPSRWINAGQPVKLTRIDELTLKISSRQPLGSILNTLCFDELALPKHRFARFHPRYNEKATYDDFRERTTRARLAFEPGTPRLSAWAPVFWARHQRAVFERNPYYWKVDPEGNQLPYVDRLEFAVIPSSDVILLRFLNGELDLIGRYLVSTSYQTLKDRERQGMFTVYLSEALPNPALYLNWDAPRLMLRKAFRKPGVRKALSYAINRQEIGNIVYSGLFRPIGISFSRTSPVYTPESAAMYTEYLPEKARALLDAEGLIPTAMDTGSSRMVPVLKLLWTSLRTPTSLTSPNSSSINGPESVLRLI